MRRAGALCFVLLLVASDLAAQQSTSVATGITLAELEKLALESNPTMRAAQARIDAARGRARQAGAWPNPTVGASLEEQPFRDTEPHGSAGIFAEQTILLGGKLRLSRAVFDRAVDRNQAELELQRQRIVSNVRRVFLQSLTVNRRIEVQQRLAALASEAVSITAQLFNVGAADRPDFLESEIESKRVQLDLNAAKNRSVALRHQLAAVVGSADVATRSLSGSLEEALPEIVRTTALRTLLDESPQIRAARAEVARTQALTALARRETFPDVFLRGGISNHRERSEADGRAIGWEGAIEAGVSIPLFNRNAGGVAAARAEELRAQAELQRLEWSLQARLAAEFASYLTALNDAEAYRAEILPRAEEAYRLYLTSYRQMAAAYPQVLIAQRNLFDLSTRYLESLEEGWQAALRIQGFLSGDGLQSPGGADEDEDSMGIVMSGERGGRR